MVALITNLTAKTVSDVFFFISVQIALPSTMKIKKGLPHVYTAVQMHLHWGGLDLETSGSEHTIDGMRYMAEVSATCNPLCIMQLMLMNQH